jgi:hypothetical protein
VLYLNGSSDRQSSVDMEQNAGNNGRRCICWHIFYAIDPGLHWQEEPTETQEGPCAPLGTTNVEGGKWFRTPCAYRPWAVWPWPTCNRKFTIRNLFEFLQMHRTSLISLYTETQTTIFVVALFSMSVCSKAISFPLYIVVSEKLHKSYSSAGNSRAKGSRRGRWGNMKTV